MRMTANTSLSSLYELPLDRPLNIDIGKFLMPKENVQYNGNDLELIQEAMKQH